jgi:hypothetical protein
VTPVYPSDRPPTEEEEEVRPRTSLSVLGLLWIGIACIGANELVRADVSLVALALVGAGACLPLVVARLRGSRDAIPVSAWVLAASLYAAGLVVTATSVSTSEFGDGVGLVAPVLLTAQAAVSALLLACGGYILTRSIGSVPAERRAIHVGSALVLGLGVARAVSIVVLLGHGFEGEPTLASAVIPLLLWGLQMAAVVWTYVRLLAARPSVKRITRVFD